MANINSMVTPKQRYNAPQTRAKVEKTMAGDRAYGDAKGGTVTRSVLEYPRAPRGSPESRGRQMLLSVVVPCANEQEVLRETNRRLVGLLDPMPLDFEIVYVDDGSTDSTLDLLRELHAQDGRVRVVRLARHVGQ